METQCPCGRPAATEVEHSNAHAVGMCAGCYDIYQYVALMVRPKHKTVHEQEAAEATVHFMPIAQLQS